MRILNILSSLNGGGVESMLYNYYNNFPNKDILFDFVVHGDKIGLLENNLLKKGSKIFHVTPKHSSCIKNIKEMWKIINKRDYDAVYCHQNFSSFIPLLIGWFKGIKIRIVHSHGINQKNNLYEKISKLFIKVFGTHFLSCSIEASICLYGNSWKEKYPKKVIIPNAIDIKKFKFSQKKRNALRDMYNLKNRICILNVGRFTYEKNHKFMVDIISKLDVNKYHLVLIGDGYLKQQIKNYANNKQVSNITFLDEKSNIEDYYSMADVFIFPSIAEGFGIVSLEAQANGLPVLASDCIPQSTDFGLIQYLPLYSIDTWIKKIKESKRLKDNKNIIKNINNKGYNMEIEAKKYYNLLKNIKGE